MRKEVKHFHSLWYKIFYLGIRVQRSPRHQFPNLRYIFDYGKAQFSSLITMLKRSVEILENSLETLLPEISSQSTHRCLEAIVGVKGEEFPAHEQHDAGHIGHVHPVAGWILHLRREGGGGNYTLL